MLDNLTTVPVGLDSNRHPFRYSKTSGTMASEILEGKTYPKIPDVPDAQVILDVGANVGAASVYFTYLYPNAKIFAIEPSPDAFEVLQENVSYYPSIESCRMGLSTGGLFNSRCGTVDPTVFDARAERHTVRPAAPALARRVDRCHTEFFQGGKFMARATRRCQQEARQEDAQGSAAYQTAQFQQIEGV